MNITAINLNLFVAFDALLEHSSVSRAARHVGVTQSAMSNSLRNLRAVFGDALFLRTSHGIVPTPRARQLAGPVREADATSGIDRALAALGQTREVSLRVSHFLNVPMLVANSDLVASLSRRVAEPFDRMLPLQLFEPPLHLRTSRIGMVWHDSLHDDPAQRWLRGAIAELCVQL